MNTKLDIIIGYGIEVSNSNKEKIECLLHKHYGYDTNKTLFFTTYSDCFNNESDLAIMLKSSIFYQSNEVGYKMGCVFNFNDFPNITNEDCEKMESLYEMLINNTENTFSIRRPRKMVFIRNS
jgi:hypothetical protein